jgi:hypothetical protein
LVDIPRSFDFGVQNSSHFVRRNKLRSVLSVKKRYLVLASKDLIKLEFPDTLGEFSDTLEELFGAIKKGIFRHFGKSFPTP